MTEPPNKTHNHYPHCGSWLIEAHMIAIGLETKAPICIEHLQAFRRVMAGLQEELDETKAELAALRQAIEEPIVD